MLRKAKPRKVGVSLLVFFSVTKSIELGPDIGILFGNYLICLKMTPTIGIVICFELSLSSHSIGESSNEVQSVLCVGGKTGVCFYTRLPVQYFFYLG